MSTVAHFFIIIVAQKFVITWLTFSLTFTQYKASLWKSGYVSKILGTSVFNPLIFKIKNKYLRRRKR